MLNPPPSPPRPPAEPHPPKPHARVRLRLSVEARARPVGAAGRGSGLTRRCAARSSPAARRSPHAYPHPHHLWGAFWLFQTLFILLADCLYTGSVLWNRAERLWGTVGFLGIPMRLLWCAPPRNKAFIVAGLAVSAPFLAYSREAKDFGEYRFRHSLWHVVSCAFLLWVARREVADWFAAEHAPHELAFWG